MLALRYMASDLVSVTLACPRTFFEYRPLAVTEPFDGTVPRYDLGELAGANGARHVRDAVASVDTGARAVSLSAAEQLEYDFLLMAVGARAVAAVPGATPFWAGTGLQEYRALVKEMEAGTVADAGGGRAGRGDWPLPAYELALQTAHALGAERGARPGRADHAGARAARGVWPPHRRAGRRAAARARQSSS